MKTSLEMACVYCRVVRESSTYMAIRKDIIYFGWTMMALIRSP